MSVISPEALIDEVKPWSKDSWRKFLENYVVPISVLADTVVKQFAGDPASEISRELAQRAKHVLNVAKKVIGEIKVEYSPPEDPVEVLRLLVEKAGNTFLGVNEGGKYTLLAWSLRKVTKEYLFKALYPVLEKDEEKRKETFRILGINEEKPLFKPAVKSKLADDLTILGYPDYPSLCRIEEWGNYVTLSVIPAKEETLGGSLCKLVDAIVALLSRPGILSAIELSSDVVKNYLDQCPSRPPEILYWTGISWKEAYQVFRDLGKFRSDYSWIIEGFAIKCVDILSSYNSWSGVHQETNLLSFLRWIMPSVIVGRTDLLFSSDWRVALTIKRTI